MKVLVIGNFLEQSGYSDQCRNTILSMDAAGLDVCAKNISILGNSCDIPERIKEIERKSTKNPDIIFLNTLPSFYEYHAGAKNVGFFVLESSNIKASGWPNKCNLMDSLINCCFWNKEVSKKSGVTKPISIVPQAIDLEKSGRDYPLHDIRKIFPSEFIFYSIGEWTTRKNMALLIRAFHTEFRPSENVQLLIKTNPANLGSNPMQTLQGKVNEIKQGLKLYRNVENYKREILMVGNTNEEEIYSIHRSADCFISTSHAESFCIPAAVAMSMGKILIVPNYGGFLEYCNSKNSLLIDGSEGDIYGATDQMADLYTAREQWFYPEAESLRISMRLAYENHTLTKKLTEQAKKDVQKLSFKNIGEQYKRVLEK